MKNPTRETQSIPLHDYGPALQSAVTWLGERYLLADPVPRRNREQPRYFTPQSWHPQSSRM